MLLGITLTTELFALLLIVPTAIALYFYVGKPLFAEARKRSVQVAVVLIEKIDLNSLNILNLLYVAMIASEALIPALLVDAELSSTVRFLVHFSLAAASLVTTFMTKTHLSYMIKSAASGKIVASFLHFLTALISAVIAISAPIVNLVIILKLLGDYRNAILLWESLTASKAYYYYSVQSYGLDPLEYSPMEVMKTNSILAMFVCVLHALLSALDACVLSLQDKPAKKEADQTNKPNQQQAATNPPAQVTDKPKTGQTQSSVTENYAIQQLRKLFQFLGYQGEELEKLVLQADKTLTPYKQPTSDPAVRIATEIANQINALILALDKYESGPPDNLRRREVANEIIKVLSSPIAQGGLGLIGLQIKFADAGARP